MKNVIILLSFIFFTSFSNKDEIKKLPNGHYLVELDKKYKDLGLNDFDFTLENENFMMKIGEQYEVLEINWIDEKTFLVKGYTEPLDPSELEKNILKKSKIYFRITKQENNSYYFTLGEEAGNYPIYSGKFVKTEK